MGRANIKIIGRRTDSSIKYQVSELHASDYINCGNAFLINFQKKVLSAINVWLIHPKFLACLFGGLFLKKCQK